MIPFDGFDKVANWFLKAPTAPSPRKKRPKRSPPPPKQTVTGVNPRPLQSGIAFTGIPQMSVTAGPELITIKEDSLISEEQMIDLLFEDIGGQEIISIARNNTVNGQEVSYQPIKNASELATQYSPENIFPIANTSNKFFNNFSIDLLSTKIPVGGVNSQGNIVASLGTGPSGEIVYLEESTGSVILNFINVRKDEQIEIQFFKSGTVFDDTIDTESES